ncbi:MAG: isoprenylcysteine carboxylmethyltransferase family protein [Rhodobacter sp.]|nr:isoprenylcysteine carboxylmethyltransferase family protein [Rhodobacter sp.]
MTSTPRATPVNQAIRVNILRAAFLTALPLAVFTRSAWPESVFELLEVAGTALVITAVLGRFWSILYIGGHKNQTVMQDGPYSICRHPLYLFSTLGVLGLGLMLGSLIMSAILGSITFVILSVTARKEEAFLRGEFGPAYDEYSARVPMILPRLAGFHTEGEIVISVRHLRQNLMDALVFLTFIPLAELLEFLKESQVLPTIGLW